MTDNERIIQLLQEQNKLLQKLIEKDQPKYETKVDVRGLIRGCDLKLVNTRNNNNEKTETED